MGKLHDQVGDLWQELSKCEWTRWRYYAVIVGGVILLAWGIYSYHVDYARPTAMPTIFMALLLWTHAFYAKVIDRIARKFRILRDSLAQTDIYVSTAGDKTEVTSELPTS